MKKVHMNITIQKEFVKMLLTDNLKKSDKLWLAGRSCDAQTEEERKAALTSESEVLVPSWSTTGGNNGAKHQRSPAQDTCRSQVLSAEF